MFSLTQCNAYSVYYTLFFQVTLSWVLSQESASTKSCAYFSFENSTIRTNSLEVTENTTITLMFYLKDKNCSNRENTVISIERMDATSYAPQCNIVLKNDTCRNTTHKDAYCICLDTVGEYTFSKIVRKSDFTWWKWSTTNGLADNVYIWFNETPIEDQTLSAASPTRTFDLSSSNTVDEELQRSITIAVVACLIIIISCLVALIIICKKRGQGKTVKSAANEDNKLDMMLNQIYNEDNKLDDMILNQIYNEENKLDDMILNQIYNGPEDTEELHTDLIHDDFTEVQFSTNHGED